MLIDSLKCFGGSLGDSPLIVYSNLDFDLNGISLRNVPVPDKAGEYALGGKPYFARAAEEDQDDFLFVDPNVIFLDDPSEISSIGGFGYKPVFHKNIGLEWGRGLDEFWARIFELTGIKDDMLFPIETVADGLTLYPYFNCGFMYHSTNKKVFSLWCEVFEGLIEDNKINTLSKSGFYNVFLHQAALVPAILKSFEPDELQLIPFEYNFPLFFHLFWESEQLFDDITGIMSVKWEKPEGYIAPAGLLKGPADKVDFLSKKMMI